MDLCTSLGIIDYERGVKLSGNGYWLYRGDGARLEWALLNYFVATHLKDGYEMILPPHMLGYNCGFGAGQFPKFADEVYWVDSEDGNKKRAKFMLPTAETALVNMYAGEILDESKLPMKFFAYTPCYRKEAGTYRAEERGMVRGHQFNKVEMVQYAHPDKSKEAFEELVNKACALMEGLGLHFRLSKLAAGDCSASWRELTTSKYGFHRWAYIKRSRPFPTPTTIRQEETTRDSKTRRRARRDSFIPLTVRGLRRRECSPR